MIDSILPEILYVQKGHVGNQDLFVNRTPHGAINQNLGVAFKAGEHVGIYRLERVVTAAVGVQDVTPVPTPPVTPTPPT